jgi:hypothetical protein
MELDFSIESTAVKYIKLYENIKYSREVKLWPKLSNSVLKKTTFPAI